MIPKIKLNNDRAQLASFPREKFFAKGGKNLSDRELMALLLGTGSARQNVLSLSDKLLKQFPLTKLSSVQTTDLMSFPGVGRTKAARIMAALELGERMYAPCHLNKVIIHSVLDTVNELKEYASKKQEYLVVLYLNARDEMLQKEVIGIGSLNSLVITPKEVFGPALIAPCSSIIVAHNHPSGDPEPSTDDIKFTQRIHEAGEVLGIRLVDHIVLAKSSYYSFRDNKVGT
jgi:DNA repair protein RadC